MVNSVDSTLMRYQQGPWYPLFVSRGWLAPAERYGCVSILWRSMRCADRRLRLCRM
jgi:hypothetical protein